MIYALFEESGQFKTAAVLSEAETSLQVENASGKRSKIKRSHVVFTFQEKDPFQLIDKASILAQEIDVAFLWEICPPDTIDVDTLAKEYYGATFSIVEKTALLLCLHEHPIYFHRKGKGQYQAAPADILATALQAQEKKRQQAKQQESWAEEMAQGIVPEALTTVLPSFLGQVDKNSLAWKAFQQAMEKTGLNVAQLLLKLQVFPHALAIHRATFLGKHFPKGTALPVLPIPDIETLPQASVEAYSIDDSSTTEIDDAFSIQALGNQVFIFGIHIACPALAIARNSPIDQQARQRLSTVYFPGEKIPMLETSLIDAFSLNEGRYTPALSLYITANIETGEILEENTLLEKVWVKENLRSDRLDSLITQDVLENPQQECPYGFLLRPMWAFSKHLQKARELVRGKPENLDRVEYLFKLDGKADDPNAIIHLIPRARHAPLDRIVAEFMILCNFSWAKKLSELGLPAIFRSQQYGRVRMSGHALAHDAIGVSHYAWTTSPLRRYVDLLNQRQLIAAVKHGVSAKLVAPYRPKDAEIHAVIAAFESAYSSYLDYQSNMERYWCLRYLEQHQITRTQAVVLRDELIRLKDVPIITPLLGLKEMAKDTIVDIDITDIDLYQLTLHCRLV